MSEKISLDSSVALSTRRAKNMKVVTSNLTLK